MLKVDDEGFWDCPKRLSVELLQDDLNKFKLRCRRASAEKTTSKKGPIKAWQEEACKRKGIGEKGDGQLLERDADTRPLIFKVGEPGREMSSQANCNGVGETSFVRNMTVQSANTNDSLCTSWLTSVSQYNEREMMYSRDSLDSGEIANTQAHTTDCLSRSNDSGAIVTTPNGLNQADIEKVRQEVTLQMRNEMLAKAKEYEAKLEEYRKKEKEWDVLTDYQYGVLDKLTSSLEAKDKAILQAAEDVERFERALNETTSLYSELKSKFHRTTVKNQLLNTQLKELQGLLKDRVNKYNNLMKEREQNDIDNKSNFNKMETEKSEQIQLLKNRVKVMEIKESALQKELIQKKKDLDDLARICDELISKKSNER
ncbi:DgyrCDS12729 [Dimorphilus gyrociliatus]|uniref:DgyrCDS12729 n=1 Tax=Dimorphilus gyrociliatus TaxID=2664684 RepID=A0A7I8W7E0_9ANNE|nr:DgyrCDS12729 [Dimorphilus gyrociliatus]